MPQSSDLSVPTDSPRSERIRPADGATTQKVRTMLQSPETYATTLLVWAIDAFGFDEETGQPYVFLWHPTTVKMEIETDYGVRLPKIVLDRLLAAITIVTTDMFFKDEARFVQLANVLAGDDFSPDVFEPADSSECAWAITEALLLVPPDEDDPEPFSDAVRAYIGHVLREEGFVRPPDILRIALSNRTDDVDGDWASDQNMKTAIDERQRELESEVTTTVKTGLRDLIEQLAALQLREGSTAKLAEKMTTTIRSL